MIINVCLIVIVLTNHMNQQQAGHHHLIYAKPPECVDIICSIS